MAFTEYYVSAVGGVVEAVTDKLDIMFERDGDVWRYTANALEQVPPVTLDTPCAQNPARTVGPTTEPALYVNPLRR